MNELNHLNRCRSGIDRFLMRMYAGVGFYHHPKNTIATKQLSCGT